MDKTRKVCYGSLCRVLDPEDQFFAAVSHNDRFLWVRFVLTDDKPNKNHERIPKEEFENVVRTALYAPIKASYLEDVDDFGGHKDAIPVGVITHLKVENDKVIGIGAIWKEEYPRVAEAVKLKVKSGDMVNLSWEAYAAEEEDQEYEGAVSLRDVIVTAVAIVGNPAYDGRTPVEKVAEMDEEKLWEEYWAEYDEIYEHVAAKWTREYINNLPDCAFLYIEPGGKKDKEGKTTPRYLRHLPVKNDKCEIDLPHLRNAISRLEQAKTGMRGGKRWLTEDLRKRLLNKARRMLERAKSKEKSGEEDTEMEKFEELKAQAEALMKENEELKAKLSEYEKELEELREFKSKIEAEMDRQRRLMEIKDKFISAGIEKEDEYFEANAEELLKMDDDALEFFIQELVAFKEAEKKEASANDEEGEDPNFVAQGDGDLIAALRRLIQEEKSEK